MIVPEASTGAPELCSSSQADVAGSTEDNSESRCVDECCHVSSTRMTPSRILCAVPLSNRDRSKPKENPSGPSSPAGASTSIIRSVFTPALVIWEGTVTSTPSREMTAGSVFCRVSMTWNTGCISGVRGGLTASTTVSKGRS